MQILSTLFSAISRRALVPLLLLSPLLGLGQTTIFTETFGAPSGTTTITTFATGTAPATFSTKALGYSYGAGTATNPADIRATNASFGYTGASGTGNAFFTTTGGEYGFAIGGIDASSYTNLMLSFGLRKEAATAYTFIVDYSTNGTSFTPLTVSGLPSAAAAAGWYGVTAVALPVGAQSGTLTLRFRKQGTAALRLDDVKLMGNSGPNIIVSATSLAAFSTNEGTASASQSYSVSGTSLTTDISIDAPAGYELALESATPGVPGAFSYPSGTPLVLVQTSGSVAITPVYARLRAAATAAGSPYNGNVIHTSSGATTKNVAVTGTVTLVSVFYYSGSGSLDNPNNFGLNTNGTGTPPANFSTAGTTFVVTGTAGTFAADWTVSGTGSKVVLDAGATMTIPASNVFAGTLDQAANSTLVILNPAVAATSGIVQGSQDPTSSIELAQAGTYSIPDIAYQNLKLTNGSKVVPGSGTAGFITVKGNLTLQSTMLGGAYQNSTSTTATFYSTIKLFGNLIQLSGVSYDRAANVTLQVMNTTAPQTLYGNGGVLEFYQLRDNAGTTLPAAVQTILANVDFTTGNPSTTVLMVANLNTGGMQLINPLSSLTLNANTTLRGFTDGAGNSGGFNFFTTHKGSLKLIDGCNLEFYRATTSSFTLGTLYIDPVFNTCTNLYLNSTAGGGANTLTLTADLNVTGLVTLANGTLVIGPNTLNLTGTLSATTGGFLQGSTTSNLTIGGTGVFGTLAFKTGFQQLRNLTLSRAGGATLTLAAPLEVTTTLDLTNGIINTTAANLLTVGYSATGNVVNGSASSYVNGPLARGTTTGAATVVFPIGAGTAYRPLTLNTTAQTGTPTYTGVVVPGSARAIAVDAPLTRVSVIRSYSLTPSVQPTAYSGTLTMSFGSDDYVNYPQDAALVVAKHDAPGNWVSISRTSAIGTDVGGAPVAGTLTSGVFTSFSDFSLASTATSSNNALNTSNPLPVQLISFSAQRQADQAVAVKWTTASEKSSAYFDVQRSLNGREFSRVATAYARGNSSQPTAYAALDKTAPAVTLYYRLRQTDTDGTAIFSPVVTVGGSSSPGDVAPAYPNPAYQTISFLTEVATSYRVLNQLGQVLLHGTAAVGIGSVALTALPPGLYFLELQTATGRAVQKFEHP